MDGPTTGRSSEKRAGTSEGEESAGGLALEGWYFSSSYISVCSAPARPIISARLLKKSPSQGQDACGLCMRYEEAQSLLKS